MERIQVKLRMTPEMKRELDKAASDKGVSLNAEVMQRLSESRKTVNRAQGGGEYWAKEAA